MVLKNFSSDIKDAIKENDEIMQGILQMQQQQQTQQP